MLHSCACGELPVLTPPVPHSCIAEPPHTVHVMSDWITTSYQQYLTHSLHTPVPHYQIWIQKYLWSGFFTLF